MIQYLVNNSTGNAEISEVGFVPYEFEFTTQAKSDGYFDLGFLVSNPKEVFAKIPGGPWLDNSLWLSTDPPDFILSTVSNQTRFTFVDPSLSAGLPKTGTKLIVLVKKLDNKGEVALNSGIRTNVSYLKSTDTLSIEAWFTQNSKTVLTATSCTITVYNDDGGIIYAPAASTDSNGEGVFKFSKNPSGLVPEDSYRAKIVIVIDGNTYNEMISIGKIDITDNPVGIADQVWDELLAEHTIAGSMAQSMDDAVEGNLGDIAEAVWDAVIKNYDDPGSSGRALNDIWGISGVNHKKTFSYLANGSLDTVTINLYWDKNLTDLRKTITGQVSSYLGALPGLLEIKDS